MYMKNIFKMHKLEAIQKSNVAYLCLSAEQFILGLLRGSEE